MTPRRFRYGADPLCLIACALYGLNRWLIKPHAHSAFIRGHFNDLLLIPCALPLVLWLQRRLNLRGHDAPPTLLEIGSHLLIWSVIDEWIGPHWLHHGTGDVWDVACYTAGAAAAALIWSLPSRRFDAAVRS